MRLFCNQCKTSITVEEYRYSKQKYNRALCREHQPKFNSTPRSTKEALSLGKALEKLGWDIKYESLVVGKRNIHVDLAIPAAKMNIEVDGAHHNLSKEQALADLKRAYYCFKKGYFTLHIPNSLTRDQNLLEETAKFIDKFLNERIDQLDDDEGLFSW